MSQEDGKAVDRVNFLELLQILLKYKKFILSLTFGLTFIVFLYVTFFAKPTYKGSVIIEIGEMIAKKDNKIKILPIDNFATIKSLVKLKFGVKSSLIDHKLLVELSYLSNDKQVIEKQLKKAEEFILNRSNKRVKSYKLKNFIDTKVIEPVKIFLKPVKPKKKLITLVSFILTLLLSIFLAFLFEFIKEIKQGVKK